MNLTFKEFMVFAETLKTFKAPQYYKIKQIGAKNNDTITKLISMTSFVDDEELWMGVKHKVLDCLRTIQLYKQQLWTQSAKLIAESPKMFKMLGKAVPEKVWDGVEIPDPYVEDITYQGFLELTKLLKFLKISNYYKIQNICVARHKSVTDLIGLSMIGTEETWIKQKPKAMAHLNIIHQSVIDLEQVLTEVNEAVRSVGLMVELCEK